MKIQLMGKDINYEMLGNGGPLLFVHGWGGDLHSMDGLFEHFAQHFKCYRLDLPGFGMSENPDSDWGVVEYANLVKVFIEKVVGSRTIYCGHSFGGSIGLYLAANTESIERMILLAPAFRRESKVETSFEEKIPLYTVFKKFLYPFRKVGYAIFYPDSQVLKYPHLEENFKKVISQDLVSMLGKIETETLIIWGSQDTFVPVKDAYLLNKSLKSSTLKIYEGIDHNIQFVEREKTIKDITCFLNNK